MTTELQHVLQLVAECGAGQVQGFPARAAAALGRTAAGGMPKAARTEARITLESAAEAIESHLGPQAIRLGSEILRTYAPFRKVRYGWQILVQFSDAPRRLNVLLTADTPFRPPLIALADPPPKLIWPHVEDDGVLCLLPESAAVDYTTPAPVLDRLLGEAVLLIEACIGPGGPPDAEFRREFLSYWGRAVDNAMIDREALNTLLHQASIEAIGVFLFSTERGADKATAYSRMFAPAIGVYEDPATGIASGPLGCYLVRHKVVTAPKAGTMLSLQGVKMGRPSYIHISIATEGTEILGVRVGGESVLAGEGTLYIP